MFDPIRPPLGGTGTFYDIYPKLRTKGNGTFCIDTANAPGLTSRNMREFPILPVNGLSDSAAAWISVRGTMEDGRFYQCALVTYSSDALEQPLPEACKNSTGVEVWYSGDQIEPSESSDSSPEGQDGTTSTWDEYGTSGESTDISTSATTTSMELAIPANETSTKVVISTHVVTSTATLVPTSSGTERQGRNSMSMLGATVEVFAIMIGILMEQILN